MDTDTEGVPIFFKRRSPGRAELDIRKVGFQFNLKIEQTHKRVGIPTVCMQSPYSVVIA